MINKFQSEEAALRDSLAKMGGMNEGLAQDKADLNAIINQVGLFHEYMKYICPIYNVIYECVPTDHYFSPEHLKNKKKRFSLCN